MSCIRFRVISLSLGFTFPHGTDLSVTGSIALGVVPPYSHRTTTCPSSFFKVRLACSFLQDFHFLQLNLSRPFNYLTSSLTNLGSFPFFGCRYFENHNFSLFVWLLRCFSSPTFSPSLVVFLFWAHGVSASEWVYSDSIPGSMDAPPKTFRSLSRPSSALSARAFTLCPWSLDQI